ncbi:hypothetical protein [Spirosoma oryzae]|nr:hypothetical protein [Spirosoma oryzae]
MKKLLVVATALVALSMGACSRRSNCPAYGSVQKSASVHQVRA